MEFITLKFGNDAIGIHNKNAAAVQLSSEGWKLESEQIEQGQFRGTRACCLSSTCCLPAGAMAGRTSGFIVMTFSREQMPAGMPHETAQQIQYRFRELTKSDQMNKQLASFGEAIQRRVAASPTARKIITIIASILVLLIVLEIVDPWSRSRHQSEQTPSDAIQSTTSEPPKALSLPLLVLKQRKEVEKALGKPISYKHRVDQGETGDPAEYPWGMVAYNLDHLVFAIYKFPKKPSNYIEAFKYLGLPSPNPPYIRSGDRTMIWNRGLHSEYSCCAGLAFNDIFIPSDFSEIHVDVLDLDDPASWSEGECSMWRTVTQESIPSRATCRDDGSSQLSSSSTAIPSQMKADLARLSKQEQVKLRKIYAKTLENKLLDSGMNAEVYTEGKDATTLVVKYILINRVLVHNFDKQNGEVLAQAKASGFKNFRMTDGYDESWSYDLQRWNP